MKMTLKCADLTRTDSTTITMAWDVRQHHKPSDFEEYIDNVPTAYE